MAIGVLEFHGIKIEGSIQIERVRCFRRLLGISCKDHVTNEEVRKTVRQCVGQYDDLLTALKKRKEEKREPTYQDLMDTRNPSFREQCKGGNYEDSERSS